MPETGFSGPSRPLTDDEIDAGVTRTAPGAYALGHRKDGSFIVEYVGRADSDVGGRLKDHIGDYKRFKFGYCGSPKAAFEKECSLWHDFGGPDGRLDNEVHPARPRGTTWTCPRCSNEPLQA